MWSNLAGPVSTTERPHRYCVARHDAKDEAMPRGRFVPAAGLVLPMAVPTGREMTRKR